VFVHQSALHQTWVYILMCTPDCYFQKFVVRGKEFIKHQHNFLRRLDEYYKLTPEYKPKFGAAQIDAQTLLKEFEKGTK